MSEEQESDSFKSLRIRFWGVQGSCPYFPAPHEVVEYTRRVAVYTLTKAFRDLFENKDESELLKQVLGGPIGLEAIEKYQQKLGMPELPVYGGETTCIEVETNEGNILIFDGGSGIRHCSSSILDRWKMREDRELHIFGSHQHLDHRSGLPFASFCLTKDRPFTLNIYGNQRFLQALDEHLGIFSHTIGPLTYRDDPLDYTIMAARFNGTEIREGLDATQDPPSHWGVHDQKDPIRVGRTEIQPFATYHGATPCLAYRVKHDGVTFVFCTDHERRHGLEFEDARQVASAEAEKRLEKYAGGADLLYIDGQYFKAEYMGLRGVGTSPPVARLDWGHGAVEDVVERSFMLKIKRTLIGHHDPSREWPVMVETDRELANICKGKACRVELAKGSMVVDL